MKTSFLFVFGFVVAGALSVIACASDDTGSTSSSSGGASSSGSTSNTGTSGSTSSSGSTATTSGGASSGNTSNSSSGGASSSSGGSTASACEAVGTELCQRACDCATDGKCHVGSESGATADFDNLQKCLDLYVTFGCTGGGDPSFDYATCDAKLKTGTCVDAAVGKAFLVPAECKSKQ